MNDTYIRFDEATKTISVDALPLDVKDSWEYGAGFFGWTAERVSEPTLAEFYAFLQKEITQQVDDTIHRTLINGTY